MKKLRKEKINKKNNKSQLIEISSFLIIVTSILVIGTTLFIDYRKDKNDNQKLNDFFEIQEDINIHDEENIVEQEPVVEKQEEKYVSYENYIAVLEINKIGIQRGIYAKDSKQNNVNRNVKLLNESDMPDKEKGNVIIAGHSGNSYVSFFKNLPKLKQGDEASIYYQGKKYVYHLMNVYEIPKIGKAHIKRNSEKNTLTLITCKHNTNMQYVFIFELENIE